MHLSKQITELRNRIERRPQTLTQFGEVHKGCVVNDGFTQLFFGRRQRVQSKQAKPDPNQGNKAILLAILRLHLAHYLLRDPQKNVLCYLIK